MSRSPTKARTSRSSGVAATPRCPSATTHRRRAEQPGTDRISASDPCQPRIRIRDHFRVTDNTHQLANHRRLRDAALRLHRLDRRPTASVPSRGRAAPPQSSPGRPSPSQPTHAPVRRQSPDDRAHLDRLASAETYYTATVRRRTGRSSPGTGTTVTEWCRCDACDQGAQPELDRLDDCIRGVVTGSVGRTADGQAHRRRWARCAAHSGGRDPR